ncbi:MAG: alpha-1,4-glucan--maltose-1-phosphate maltosyltransferase [Chloroflexota bacterium]|nr:alpha-1,4-glucan--maltose-1-phosphate maltosyltransferase [Chloroflexota bacterium]
MVHEFGTATTAPPSSILIEHLSPELDCGRYPVKREVGDVLRVEADIFKEGHDRIAAVVRYRRWDDSEWLEADMHHVDNDRWAGSFLLPENTRYCYTVQAFSDVFRTWREGLEKKAAAGQDVGSELQEGLEIVAEAMERADEDDRLLFQRTIQAVGEAASQGIAVRLMLGDELDAAMRRHRSRAGAAIYVPELSVVVDRVGARYAAWYELFPRSAGRIPGQSGTFADAVARLPAIKAMGFDVIYFPPIHPIGRINRKGKNNSLVAGPDDPGSPYAIGNETGGHDAVEPSLGTLDDFRVFVEAARSVGMDVALDFAIQCAPDHPWVKDHPDWFYVRPDGTIKYAENPPKKYEDIYPINFETADWRNLWQELKRIVLFWIDQGVTIFRVDNPHTKPTVFWEWLIAEVQQVHPETIFLSEAFTRPKVMKALAKAGFTQSYTYFTWRNFKRELTEYLIELTQSEMAEYFRGNFFTSTPDILPVILQEGGRPAFKMRIALAATLSSVYGMYSGYELCEATPVPGKEEYLNSEKYEYKVWDWDRPGNIVDFVTAINRMRREHPALHEYDNLRFYPADDDNVVCYGKATADHSDIVVGVVNLDPFQPHEATIHLPVEDFGINSDEQYRATDLLTGETFIWTGGAQHLRLDPHEEPARFFSLQRWARVDYAEPCF